MSLRTSSIRIATAITCVASMGLSQAAGLDTEDADAEPEPAFESVRLAALSDPTAVSFALARAEASPPTLNPLRLSLEGHVEQQTGLRPQLRQGGISTTLVDVSNRVWLGWGRAAFGLGFGAQTPRIDQPLGFVETPLQPTRPSVSLGLRYSFTPTAGFYAGATAARAWGEEGLPRYNARAGVEWKAAKSRLGFDGGRLGIQLDSGYRMSIRTRSGGVQLALRRTF